MLEQNRIRRILDTIKGCFDIYVARNGFEEICRRRLIFLGDNSELPFVPYFVGRIWNRKVEIDIATQDQSIIINPYERNIGMVFQDFALWPHMTVEKNI